MSINKYDKLIQKDWSWKTAIPQLPQLDYQALDSLLAQNQQQIDQVNLLSEKNPNVLNTEHDRALYQEYRKSADQGLQEVTNAYMQSPTQGGLAYKRFLNQIRKDWNPGGRADVLNKRYEGYNQALKQSDDFYKDETDPVNKFLTRRALQEQLNQSIDYDPSTGAYRSISTPELYKNPNINKAVDDMLKEIKANGTTSFLGDLNKDWWIQRIKTEQREPERIKLAFEALSQQPQYSSQINRDVQYKTLNTDEEQYRQNFEKSQKSNYNYLTKSNEEAKKDKSKAAEWQQFLRSEGYNVDVDGNYGPLTEKASEDFLKNKNQEVSNNINNFDFNKSVRKDVYDSYQNYALRGAFKEKDINLIFNQSLKAKADIAQKAEENRINRYRAEMEFKPTDQANVTVVSGIAQQLPELQKHYSDLKTQRDQTKADLDKVISKSEVFKGWTLDNIAIAYDKWSKVSGSTEEEKKANFKQSLNQNGSYPFSDEQVDLLYKEMNAPVGRSGLKTALETYSDINTEAQRFEESQSAINTQYLDTVEGKENLKRLELFRRSNESDQQLMDRAVNDPNSFSTSGGNKDLQFSNWFKSDSNKKDNFNPAVQFAEQRSKDIQSQQKNGKNYNWGSLGTYEVWTNSKDEILKPKLDAIAKAVETGTGKNFTSFGKAGLYFKDNNGDDVDGQTKKVTGMGVTVENNKPVLKLNVTFTNAEGKNKDGYTLIELVPGSPESRQIQNALEKEYASMINAGDKISAEGILDNIEALKGADRIKSSSLDLQKNNLNLKNTNVEPIYKFDPITNQLIDVTTWGWQSRDMGDDSNILGFNYKTYGFSTPSGNYLGNVLIDEQGRKVLVPSHNGEVVYNSSSGIQKARTGKEILGRTPIEVTKTKQ